MHRTHFASPSTSFHYGALFCALFSFTRLSTTILEPLTHIKNMLLTCEPMLKPSQQRHSKPSHIGSRCSDSFHDPFSAVCDRPLRHEEWSPSCWEGLVVIQKQRQLQDRVDACAGICDRLPDNPKRCVAASLGGRAAMVPVVCQRESEDGGSRYQIRRTDVEATDVATTNRRTMESCLGSFLLHSPQLTSP
jgi:hypothetical protein